MHVKKMEQLEQNHKKEKKNMKVHIYTKERKEKRKEKMMLEK